LTTPIVNAFVNAKEGRFWASIDEKQLFREWTSVASKLRMTRAPSRNVGKFYRTVKLSADNLCLFQFTTGLSYQLLIISTNICHLAIELAVVPDMGSGDLSTWGTSGAQAPGTHAWKHPRGVH
jgi:hypothetical protein